MSGIAPQAACPGSRPAAGSPSRADVTLIGSKLVPVRRITSRAVLMRRLLSLDYVIEHPRLPWLPTEAEKVAACEALGIERRVPPGPEAVSRPSQRPRPPADAASATGIPIPPSMVNA